MKGVFLAIAVLWSLVVPLGISQQCSADEFRPPWPDHVRHAAFALPSAGSPVLIPVTAYSRGLVFIVDATIPYSVIHDRHRDWLEPIPTDDIGNRPRWHKSPPLSIRGLPLPKVDKIAAADLIGYEGVLGTRIDGVLGADILKKLVLYVDNDNDKAAIALADAAPLVPREESLKVTYDRQGVPTIELKAGNVTDQFYVDLIAWHSATFTAELTDKLLAARSLRLNDTFRIITTRRGAEETRLDLRCTQLSIGQSQIRDVVCYRDDRNVMAYGILSRYRITLVLPEDRIVLTPAGGIGAADHTDKDGIDFAKASWGNEVIFVGDKMAGDRAGLKNRDIILKVDGVDVTERSRDDVCRRLFLERTAPTTVMVRRGNTDVEVTLPK